MAAALQAIRNELAVVASPMSLAAEPKGCGVAAADDEMVGVYIADDVGTQADVGAMGAVLLLMAVVSSWPRGQNEDQEPVASHADPTRLIY